MIAKNKLKRRAEIIRLLSELSRDGWAASQPSDYEPLERELREIEQHASRHAR